MGRHRQAFKSLPGSQAGAAVVEFALVIGLLLLLVGGMIEFGRVMWYYDALAKATRDAARMMSVADFSDASGAVAKSKAAVVAAAGSARVSGLTADNVAVDCQNGTSSGACDGGSFTSSSLPTRVTVAISSGSAAQPYSVTVGAMLPLLGADLSLWGPFDRVLLPRTTMPYMR